MLERANSDPTFMKRIVTGDEAWVYEFDMVTSQQASEWRLPTEPKPKRARQTRSKLNARLRSAMAACLSGVQEFESRLEFPAMENEGFLPIPKGFGTSAVHAGKDPDKWRSAASVPPISVAANYKRPTPCLDEGHLYTRMSNPTRDCLQEGLAELDNAKYCLCYSSGMGAIGAIGHLLKTGDHVVSVDNIYGGTYRAFTEVFKPMGIETTFVDGTDLKNVEKAIKPNTRMFWIETPTNPLLIVIDIKAMVALARKHKDIIVVVDNTFLTPFFQRPLDFGVDICMYSVSKYLNGHSDVVMGAITTNDEKLYKKLNYMLIYLGTCPSAFDCYLVCRSLNTLELRMTAHMNNGLKVARYLDKHPMVEKVIHPAFPSHPQHELAKRQSCGHSGMLAVYLKANLEQTTKFLTSLKLFMLAGSLGGHRSTSALCCIMTHPQYPKDVLEKMGVTENFIRLSIGLENADDLIADLEQGFTAIKKM